MKPYTFHLLPNAHLDPVWLWDWREGLNEGIITTRTILDLMGEFEELTFMRGETALYRHIEEHDPSTFARLMAMVEAGRWDIVGGTVLQPDTNLPATETFARHFTHGLQYFADRFGKRPRVAWAADSFGHTAGLPEVLAAAGMTGFAFTRPFPDTLPIAKPAFWWEGPGGSRVLAYRPAAGWYGADREEMPRRLDATLEAASKCDLENVGVFFGLGNHGGGPTRHQILAVRKWAEAHPEVRVVYSGLHRFFDAVRKEVARRGGEGFLPTHRGELNFCLRGCYVSVAKHKFLFRRTEAALSSAERTDTAIRTALEQPILSPDDTWDDLLFNSFHDILPGSSIERAHDEQLAWLGGAFHAAQKLELGALNALAQAVDTSVPDAVGDLPTPVSMLAWNPHPWPFEGHLEWEACVDYRPIVAYKGRAAELPLEVRGPTGRKVPFQVIATEAVLDGWESPWRRRIVMPAQLPPFGWGVFRMGWVEGSTVPAVAPSVASPRPDTITNGSVTVRAAAGDLGVRIARNGKAFLGGKGLSAIVVADPYGSWGGPEAAEAAGLSDVLETWTVERADVLERGPERAALLVRFVGARSWIELTFRLYRDRDAVDVAARVLWNERAARLKLVFPAGAVEAEFDVPGATVRRAPCGEVPGGRWVRAFGKDGAPVLGFASDALYGFDMARGALRASVVRASGYAYGTLPALPAWRPAVDCGELKFNFLLTPGGGDLPTRAATLEQPPVALLTAPSGGALARSGSLAALAPASLCLLAFKRASDGDGLVLRVQERGGRDTAATFTWLGKPLKLGTVRAGTIVTWRLKPGRRGWSAERVDIAETAGK
jgi:alpha-mannosidase